MLNIIWIVMIIVGILYGALTGNIDKISNSMLGSSKEAVELCITMLGIMSVWMGIMNIAQESGLIAKIEKKIDFFIRWLFPNVPSSHPAKKYIVENIIANILGLGWAATPAGLKAMENLEKYPIGDMPKDVATNEMCTFLVLNISSLQLIPINIIAYRSMYGAVNPGAVIVPAIIATSASTITGVVFCKILCANVKKYRKLKTK